MEGLIRDGHIITLLTLPNDNSIEQTEKVNIIRGDLNSLDSLNSLTNGCEVLFHLAGKVHHIPKSESEEQEFYRINVDGTKNLINAAKVNSVNRIVFFSTVGVYGKDADFKGDENSPSNPVTAYAKSKLMAEKLVLESSQNGGPKGVVLRFPVVYGPLDRGNVAKMIAAVHKKIFFYFGDGTYKRSMISSTNAAEAAIKSAFEPGAANETFLVTDGQDYTLKEFTNIICEALGTNWRPFHIPISIAKLAGHIGDGVQKITPFNFPLNSDRVSKLSGSLTFSCEKAKRILNYKPIESLSEGINREVEWLKAEKGWN